MTMQLCLIKTLLELWNYSEHVLNKNYCKNRVHFSEYWKFGWRKSNKKYLRKLYLSLESSRNCWISFGTDIWLNDWVAEWVKWALQLGRKRATHRCEMRKTLCNTKIISNRKSGRKLRISIIIICSDEQKFGAKTITLTCNVNPFYVNEKVSNFSRHVNTSRPVYLPNFKRICSHEMVNPKFKEKSRLPKDLLATIEKRWVRCKLAIVNSSRPKSNVRRL